MDNTVNNLRAVIIGASSGIGREVATLLSAAGYSLAIAARRVELLDELAKSLPTPVITRRVDVTSTDATTDLRSLINDLGGMDLFFYATGVGHQNRSLDEAIEMQTVETNALGFSRMVGEAFRFFAAQGHGHIAAISSIAGTMGLGPSPSYSATKALQATYLQSLAQLAHIRHLDICITDIRPGFVDTPLLKDDHYPMLMKPTAVAKDIVRAIREKRRIVTIDWRYRLLVFFWRLIPDFLWIRLKL